MLVCSLDHSKSHFWSACGAMGSNGNAPETLDGVSLSSSRCIIDGAELASIVGIIGGYHLVQNSRTDVRVGVAR